MSRPEPRVTKKRVLAGLAVLVVASAVMYAAGANLRSYGLGVVVGAAGVAAIAYIAARRQKAARAGRDRY